MPRLPHIGAVLSSTVQEAADLCESAFDLCMEAIHDGVITEEEVQAIKVMHARSEAALDAACDEADRTALALNVVRSVIESPSGKRTKAAIREWNGLTVIEGGLAAEAGGVA